MKNVHVIISLSNILILVLYCNYDNIQYVQYKCYSQCPGQSICYFVFHISAEALTKKYQLILVKNTKNKILCTYVTFMISTFVKLMHGNNVLHCVAIISIVFRNISEHHTLSKMYKSCHWDGIPDIPFYL